MKILTQEDNGKEISVRQGSIIEVHLTAMGGTGYAWEFQDLDRDHFDIVGAETQSTANLEATGAPVIKTWRLKATSAGETQLELDCFRPWEGKDKAIERFRVKVRIVKEP